MTMSKLEQRKFRYWLVAYVLIAAPAFAQDPGTPGPCTVASAEYNFGDTAFTPTDFPGPVEVIAQVRYPVANATCPGPFPMVIFLHGRHGTCYSGASAFLEWPCSPGRSSIPSYQGYGYIQDVLASWGYIVASIGANGVNAVDNFVFDLGANARAQLIQHHLDRWNTWNTMDAPPFGALFVGKVNLNNVGTMGHSRGGEGVAAHFILNRDLLGPYTIRAVLPLAPVDFTRPDVTNVPLGVILPYCDGDVSDLQGAHFVDDVRYADGDPTPKHTTLVMGANHNHFNTIWTPGGWPAGTAEDWTAFVPGGTADPWCGNVSGSHKLPPANQRGVGLAYIVGFFRRYLGNEAQFAPLWKGDARPPPSATTTEIVQSYLPADSPSTRLDVNRLLTASDLTNNWLGGTVAQGGLSPFDLCGGEAPQPQHCLTQPSTERLPHTTPSARSDRRGLSQLRFGWSAAAAFMRNDIPPGLGDVSSLAALQFRASVNFEDARNPMNAAQDFSVTLTDGVGISATTIVSGSSAALYFPPGGPAVTPLPKTVLNSVRVPLARFPGVDLTNIQSITFNFDRTGSGALLISDLQFAD
jgi:hypothetical protein